MTTKKSWSRLFVTFTIALAVTMVYVTLVLTLHLRLAKESYLHLALVAAIPSIIALFALISLLGKTGDVFKRRDDLLIIVAHVGAQHAYDEILHPLALTLHVRFKEMVDHQRGLSDVLDGYDANRVLEEQGEEGLLALAQGERHLLGMRIEYRLEKAKAKFWSMHDLLAGLPHLKGLFGGTREKYKDYLLPFDDFAAQRAKEPRAA